MKCENNEILNNEENLEKILSEDRLLLDNNKRKNDKLKPYDKSKKYLFHKFLDTKIIT